MNGVLYVEWNNEAEPPQPRYTGFGEIDGVRVSVVGDLREDAQGHKSVRLVVRAFTNQQRVAR